LPRPVERSRVVDVSWANSYGHGLQPLINYYVNLYPLSMFESIISYLPLASTVVLFIATRLPHGFGNSIILLHTPEVF